MDRMELEVHRIRAPGESVQELREIGMDVETVRTTVVRQEGHGPAAGGRDLPDLRLDGLDGSAR